MGPALSKTPPPAAPPYDPEQRWWTPSTVAVVTGSNKGLGLCIARGLVDAGVLTVLTSRSPALGEAALATLKAEGRENVAYHQLDVTDKDSIDKFKKWVGETHKGVDILVNNAGILSRDPNSWSPLEATGPGFARKTLATNYQGVRNVTEALLPLLRPSRAGARIVNVSSGLGILRIVSAELQKRFLKPDLSLVDIDALKDEFLACVEKGTAKQQGWSTSGYGVSKALLNAYTRVLARQLADRPEGEKAFVNSYNPGWCATDMGSSLAFRSPELGADTAVFLALQPRESATSGALYKDRKQVDPVSGKEIHEGP